MRASCALLTLLALGCSSGSTTTDGSPGTDGGVRDTGPRPDAGPRPDSGPLPDAGPVPVVMGHAYYSVGEESFRIEGRAGATPENVSTALNRLGAGTRDRFASASADGEWIAMASDRAGCGGECLVLVKGDLSAIEAVKPDGQEAYPEGTPALANARRAIVYAAKGGPHEIDLWSTVPDGAGWSAPVLLTGASTYQYNNDPTFSLDESTVLFDCGANPYPEDGDNDACDVRIDSTGFHKVVGPDALPSPRNNFVHFPHASPDGVLFESSWPVGAEMPETIWLLPTAGGDPTPIAGAFNNAVSPCGLRDGRFFMLWLGRPGNAAGKHELTLVARDGTLISVLTPDVDVNDIGIGCSD